MTNSNLSTFKNSIHHSLKAKEKGGCLCVCEQDEKSSIKHICFHKGNGDDILILQQDINNCPSIQNLFEEKARVDSCDFIVLICKNQELHIFFCEIKSSICNDNIKKSLNQINSSKIFLEYLYQNYLQHFTPENFEISVKNGKNIYIYPASNSQKTSTSASSGNSMKFEKVKINSSGNVHINDIYKFFKV